jgi:hypothetical protein
MTTSTADAGYQISLKCSFKETHGQTITMEEHKDKMTKYVFHN